MKKQLLAICLTVIFAFTNAKAQKPLISFFNEMEGVPLKQLFSDTSIIPHLQSLHAQIRMGMLDTSIERVEVIKQLNKKNIPVVAWLLLPKEKGYWFHSKNGPAAVTRYHEIQKWAYRNQIVFSGIGLDLELDINDIDLIKNHPFKLGGKIIQRLYDKQQISDGKKLYQALIADIKKDGYKVESYYVPFIRFENEEGRTALQQVSGFLDVKTDNDIPMLYSSFMGNGYGLLKILAKDQGIKAVAIGSTGGGFDTTLKTMNWDHFKYDLQYASSFANEVHIFSLEGAVQKGFLNKMDSIDLHAIIVEKPEEEKSVKKIKNIVMSISTILSYPTLLITITFLLFGLILGLLFYLIKKLINKFK
jgi:hypothetical protein